MNEKLAARSSLTKAAFHKPVQDPWQIPTDEFPVDGTHEEQLWFALNYAVLAPSTHNTQPWRFALFEKDVDLYSDLTRGLPVVDPQGRELIMSCGAALSYLRLALGYFGHAPRVDLFPDIDRSDWLARIHMEGLAAVDSETILLFQAIQQRSTNRQRFADRPVPSDLLSELKRVAQSEGAWFRVIDEENDRTAVADLVAEGDRRQWADKEFRKELADWVRPLDSSSRDGLPVTTQEMGTLLAHAGPLVIRTFDLGKGHAAKDREIALHSPVLAVLGTDNDDPVAWLAAGQALARVLLRAQGENVSASFLNQPIEVAELRPCLADILAQEGTPQLLLRMGYADPVRHTPRRSVGDVVRMHAAHG